MWVREARGRITDLESYGIYRVVMPHAIVEIGKGDETPAQVQTVIDAGLLEPVVPMHDPKGNILGFSDMVVVPMNEQVGPMDDESTEE